MQRHVNFLKCVPALKLRSQFARWRRTPYLDRYLVLDPFEPAHARHRLPRQSQVPDVATKRGLSCSKGGAGRLQIAFPVIASVRRRVPAVPQMPQWRSRGSSQGPQLGSSVASVR